MISAHRLHQAGQGPPQPALDRSASSAAAIPLSLGHFGQVSITVCSHFPFSDASVLCLGHIGQVSISSCSRLPFSDASVLCLGQPGQVDVTICSQIGSEVVAVRQGLTGGCQLKLQCPSAAFTSLQSQALTILLQTVMSACQGWLRLETSRLREQEAGAVAAHDGNVQHKCPLPRPDVLCRLLKAVSHWSLESGTACA